MSHNRFLQGLQRKQTVAIDKESRQPLTVCRFLSFHCISTASIGRAMYTCNCNTPHCPRTHSFISSMHCRSHCQFCLVRCCTCCIPSSIGDPAHGLAATADQWHETSTFFVCYMLQLTSTPPLVLHKLALQRCCIS